jgi:hypothetical protein
MSDIHDQYPSDDPDVIELSFVSSDDLRRGGAAVSPSEASRLLSPAIKRAADQQAGPHAANGMYTSHLTPMNLSQHAIAPDADHDISLDDADNAMTDGEQIRWLHVHVPGRFAPPFRSSFQYQSDIERERDAW